MSSTALARVPGTYTDAPKLTALAMDDLQFPAVRDEDAGRISFVGRIAVRRLFEGHFIDLVASAGLTPEVLQLAATNGAVQRKTDPAHIQPIVDYIVAQAEKGEPWMFGSSVLYSASGLQYDAVSVGREATGVVTVTERLGVGEGLHRILSWGVVTGHTKVRGVKCPDMSEAAQSRILLATIPVIVIEEDDPSRKRGDFHVLNLQKPLTSTVLTLTDDTVLSKLTRKLIAGNKLFDGRIELNNSAVGPTSVKLCSFYQLRFAVGSLLLGKNTRTPRGITEGVARIVSERGEAEVLAYLRSAFNQIARLGGLQRLLTNTFASTNGDFVRTLRSQTLLASNPTWRAITIGLHHAQQAGVDAETAIDRVKEYQISWARDSQFFAGTLLEQELDETGKPTGKLTGKLLSSRESIDRAADKLAAVMTKETLSL